MKTHNSASPDRLAHSAKLAGMMDQYFHMLNDLVDKCRTLVGPKAEVLQPIARMMQIAAAYERDQVQLEQRQKTLELRQAEYELKAKRAAQAEKRHQAQLSAKGPPAGRPLRGRRHVNYPNRIALN